ncbi:glycosyl hydrolase [Halorhabdus sp. CUG00001]|uniref:glycosyl hydrolase n=1 Tax=Halorhabdus sp. CUG00001 TaxID=2600297 RepID=UPI00131B2227|nr:glycosyl hydrolase [Halorhabdus sp. CUG00001]
MSDNTDTPSLDLSRRTFVKGVGAAGAAGATAGTVAAEVNDDDVVSVGSGSFTTAIPAGYDYPSPPTPEYVTENVSPPIPTNDWWSGLLFGTFSSGPVIGLPYYSDPGENGLTIKHPTAWAGDPAEQDTIVADWDNTPGLVVGHQRVDEFEDARVNDWGDWHVQTRLGATANMWVDVTQARGSPFLFAECVGGPAELTLTDAADEPAQDEQVSVFADQGNVLGVTVEGEHYDQHFGIFAPSSASWEGLGTATLTSGLGDGTSLTVAVLPEASTDLLSTFEEYAYNHVVGTTIDWEYVQTDDEGNPVSEVRTTYSFETEAKPESTAEGTLTALFPHQWKYAEEPFADVTYWSPRGEMKVKTGTSFTTAHTYQGILPFESTDGTQDMAQLESYVTGLMEDNDRYEWPAPHSAYWVGKDFYRNSVVAPIAQQTGQTEAQEYFTTAVTDRLEAWLTAGDTSMGTEAGQELFYYDDALGSLFEYPTDFGSVAAITDHHFHYGYFVYGAAEAARTNPEWASEDNWGGMVNRLIRDYANWERPDHDAALDPAGDPKNAFPFLRNFDVYGGHSWAGGTVGNPKGNNQESSSEAVMAYAAMIRWGEMTGDDALRDAGIFLYTQETASVWDYWFDPEDDSLPDDWGANFDSFGTAGPDFEYASNVWGGGYWRSLWWAASDPIEVFGINWLPIGGHSFYLGHDTTYANANWQALLDARDRHLDGENPETGFLGGFEPTAWGYRAMSNPSEAASLVDEALPVGPGGNSSPFIYNFVHFIEGAGLVDTDVVGDVPFHQVFEDGETRTYVAYNADSAEITASFSDGMELSVPAGEIVVESTAEHYEPDTAAPSTPSNLEATMTNSYATELAWDGSTDPSGIQYYAVYLDGEEYTTVGAPEVRIDELSRGTDYTIAVEAVDPFGNASPQATIDVTTDSEDTAPPNAPRNPQTGSPSKTSIDLSWEAASDVGEGSGIDHYAVLVDGQEYTTTAETSVALDDLDPGTKYTFGVVAVDGAGNESRPVTVDAQTVAEGATQRPFQGERRQIPGKIEAEHFDQGGEGVSYHETSDVNQAGADYRDGPVDIGDAGGGNYTIGYIPEGEWLEYSVTVESTAEYDIIVSVASAEGGGPIHIEVDGEDVTGQIDVPNTGSWTGYTTVTGAKDVQLAGGDHVVRVVADGGAWNFDWMRFDGGGEETPTETATPTATETATETPESPQQQSKTEPEPTATTTSGPGFTVVSMILGLFGLSAYLLHNDDDETL